MTRFSTSDPSVQLLSRATPHLASRRQSPRFNNCVGLAIFIPWRGWPSIRRGAFCCSTCPAWRCGSRPTSPVLLSAASHIVAALTGAWSSRQARSPRPKARPPAEEPSEGILAGISSTFMPTDIDGRAASRPERDDQGNVVGPSVDDDK
jgi:hypothetical protein